MKKLDLALYVIISAASAGILYFGAGAMREPFYPDDPREKAFLSTELKRSAVAPAIRYIEEQKFEEAAVTLAGMRRDGNPYAMWLMGFVYFKTGRKAEGLDLIRTAMRNDRVLYDSAYPHNIRKELERISSAIRGDDNLTHYRHFIESKLKGGCG